MYVPRPFQPGAQSAAALVRELVVGHLVTATATGPLATFVPWVVDLERGVLLGHIARANPQWRTPWTGRALVISENANGYVSPSWYATKAETGRVVPTWDYVALQIHGELTVHDDPTWVRDVVHRLTERHESVRPAPWRVEDAPADYLEMQLRAIVGVEVRIEAIEAAEKLSQNKSEADAAGVVTGFAADGHTVLSELVRRATTER